MAKQIESTTERSPEYYALESAPRGHALFCYFLAVLTVNGMMHPSRREAPFAAINRFFYSPAALNHHTRNGNLEKVQGMVRITVQGWNYFQGRLTGQTTGQSVDKAEMLAMVKAIYTGKFESKTAHFGPSTKMRKVQII